MSVALVPDPTDRHVRSISSHHGTLTFATMFNGIASVSKAVTDARRKSHLAVPGVVITQEILPLAVILHTRPICQYPAGNVVGTYVGTHDAVAAAVRVGPSVYALAITCTAICFLLYIKILYYF
jgi:hypothetical protein